MAEYYVSSQASGGGDGSEGDPWTIAEATAGHAAGDTIYVKADGTYNVQDGSSDSILNIQTIGTTQAPVFWRAYSSTISDGGIVTFDAQSTLSYGITSAVGGSVSSYHRFEGFQIINSIDFGFNAPGLNNVTIDRCRISSCSSGINLDNSNRILRSSIDNISTGNGILIRENNFVIANKFFNITGDIPLDILQESLVNGNLFYGNGGNTNIVSSQGRMMILNNTFDGDGASGSQAVEFTGSGDTPFLFINNLIMDMDIGMGISDADSAGYTTRRYNMFVNVTTPYQIIDLDYTDIETSTDPFTDSANRDYTLAVGSAARNAGLDILGVPSF